MNNRPTPERVQQEIATLQEIKPRVRRRNFFGDDNHAAIDAQIAVLKNGLDEDAIDAQWSDNEHTLDSALEALAWRNGEDVDSLEDGLVAAWLKTGLG